VKGGFETEDDATFFMNEHYNHKVCSVDKDNKFYGFDFNDSEISYIGRFQDALEADEATIEDNESYGFTFSEVEIYTLLESISNALEKDSH